MNEDETKTKHYVLFHFTSYFSFYGILWDYFIVLSGVCCQTPVGGEAGEADAGGAPLDRSHQISHCLPANAVRYSTGIPRS